jgi:predicted acetyltransferase
MNDEPFTFLDPGQLVDGDLELVVVAQTPGDESRNLAPAYAFEMRLTGTATKVGDINLRIGNMDRIVLYGGHIGYNVDPAHRGHHYAARSCRLLLPFVKRHGINPLWITCSPENTASRRTCERAGGILVEIVDLPEDNDMYQEGERRKCRYRFDL